MTASRLRISYEVLALTNEFRVQNSVLPLSLNTELMEAASFHSQDMAHRDYVNHVSPTGDSDLRSRLDGAGHNSRRASENIAAGQPSSNVVVNSWINSPSHQANLLSPQFKELGVGYYFLANDTGSMNYQNYWVQVFGSGDSSQSGQNLRSSSVASLPTTLSPIKPVKLFSGDVNDNFLVGSEVSDTLSGRSGNDQLYGKQGNDALFAGAGNDVLGGGQGNDQLFGGAGDDGIYGKRDNDVLFGEAGNDILGGGQGDDQLFGESGDDQLNGKRDNDLVSGGDGNDELIGGLGDDRVYGNQGNDVLWGETGDDILGGGQGDDQLFGGEGKDVVQGKAGNDVLVGGAGQDILTGGTGNDTLVGVDQSAGRGRGELDVLMGQEGQDFLMLGDVAGVFYNDGNISDEGYSDYARIVQMDAQDRIQLAGSLEDYLLRGAVTVDERTGTGIFWRSDSSASGEFIALVQDTGIAETQAALTFV